jgi:dCTP deaminase
MFLSANEIRAEVEKGRLLISPFHATLLKRASYILRFSDRWRQWHGSASPIDVWSPNAADSHLGPTQRVATNVVDVGSFWLTSTFEKLALPDDLVGVVAPLSHLARFGLMIDQGACFVTPGFGSEDPTSLTLEVSSCNPTPLRIRAGMPACHLAFSRTTPAVVERLARSVYDGRESPSAPLLFEEFSTLPLFTDEEADAPK